MGAGSPSGKSSNVLLIVLLAVVAVPLLGVFASLAVYGTKKYLTNAKTAEARVVSVELANGIARCAPGGTLPESTRPVPAALALVNGMKYQSKPSDWSDEAFRCAGFTRAEPQYFQYQWQRLDERHGSVSARADFDQDGVVDHGYEVRVTCAGVACSADVAATDVTTGTTGTTGTAPGTAPEKDPPVILLVAVGIGMLAVFAASIWTVVLAFGESVLWGLAVLFVPCASLYFTIKFWHKARAPFLLQLGAFGFMFAVGMISAMVGAGQNAKAAAPRTATETDFADKPAIAAAPPAVPPPPPEPEPTPAPKLDGSSVAATDVLADAQLRATKWDAAASLVAIEILGIRGGKVETPDGGAVFATYRRNIGTSRSKNDQLVVSYDKDGLREQESRSSAELPALFDPHCTAERVAQIAEGFLKTPSPLNLKYTKDLRRDRIVWVASVPGGKEPPRTFDGQSCTILVR